MATIIETPTGAEALTISLSETGRVDLERMSALLGKSEQAVIDELFTEAEEDSKTDRQRIAELKQLQLNGLDAIASLYEAMGGEQ